MPTPVQSFAYLLGRRSAAEEAKIEKLRKQKQTSDLGVAKFKAERAAQYADFRTSLAVLMEKPAVAAKSTAAKRVTSKKAVKPVPARTVAKRNRFGFAHLAPAPFEIEDDTAPAAAKAQAIIVSAAKARSAASVTKPPKGTAAAAILAAAAKRDTPTGTSAPKPKGLAAAIVAAGRKARGEV
jgi:hypothetical protein